MKRKINLTFAAIALFLALFAAINFVVVWNTDYSLYLFGLHGGDLVTLPIMALTALGAVRLLLALKWSERQLLVKMVLLIILAVAMWLVFLAEAFLWAFTSGSGGDRYEFTSPDGKRTLLVYERQGFPDDWEIFAYEKELPFAVRSLGYMGYIGVCQDGDEPRGNYDIDWSGGDPTVTPIPREPDQPREEENSPI